MMKRETNRKRLHTNLATIESSLNSETIKKQCNAASCPLNDSSENTETGNNKKNNTYLTNVFPQCLNATIDQSDVKSDEIDDQLIGDHETQESEGGEADLHKYLVDCKKNPGHSQFIPVDTFTLKHLPEGFQDNDLYEYIKVIADLTVKVGVKMTSTDRPKLWPKTNKSYAFYDKRGKTTLRTGSGWVREVNKFQDGVKQDGSFGLTDYTKCWCRKCEDSDSPNNVWWEFDMQTAAHLVFDSNEASHTTLRLFYDRDDSPVVNVDKVSVVDVNIQYDYCSLKCVTCDKSLGNKLMEMFKHFENVKEKVWGKYHDSRSQHKFNFIVSHPHGCSKQVSIGQWKDKHKVNYKSKFFYTTPTCAGSSGANVHSLGFHDWSLLSDIIHSGTSNGINYSTASCIF